MKKVLIFQNQYLVVSTILLFINLTLSGCYSLQEIKVDKNEAVKIYKIELLDGKIIDFKDNRFGYAVLSNDQVISENKIGEKETYLVQDVKKFYTEKFDIGNTIWLGIGTVTLTFAALIGLIAIGMGGGGVGG